MLNIIVIKKKLGVLLTKNCVLLAYKINNLLRLTSHLFSAHLELHFQINKNGIIRHFSSCLLQKRVDDLTIIVIFPLLNYFFIIPEIMNVMKSWDTNKKSNQQSKYNAKCFRIIVAESRGYCFFLFIVDHLEATAFFLL